MKTDSGIIHYSSKQDYLNKTPSKKGLSQLSGKAKDLIAKSPDGLAKGKEASKVEISDEAKEKAKSLKNDLKNVPKKIEAKAKETGKLGGHLASEAVGTLKKAFDTMPGLSNIPLPGQTSSGAIKDLKTPKGEIVDKPAIFFVTDFSINPFDDDSFGLTGMAKNIPGTEKFNWDDEDKILEEIKKRPHTQPVILVGHGVGSDTLVNVANKLNTVEHGFRSIDLLVTMDSIGFDNDIISSNVGRNLNYISDQDVFFNDGPNIARKNDLTRVINNLRQESHSEIDEAPDVQFEVFENINSVLTDFISRRKINKPMNISIHNPNQNG